ncbi:MAG: ComF family protein [Desulfomonile tiedjei]|uniref:ComF family protein n=1 Tax=Desulfomonile tiedjei TaxID=2358 RepID=A0A9D6Z1E6_9BACT|nr:ComF family protein [Desulfomonile tiedjei]
MGIRMFVTEGLSSFKNALSDLFFPPTCPFCDSPDVDSGAWLCYDCTDSISKIEEPFCSQCGLPLPENNPDGALFCGQCLIATPAYHRARYGVKYKGTLREGLKRFKYGGALHATDALSGILIEAYRRHYEHDEFDLILPIPIHRKKLWERGFNQVIVLTEKLSRHVGIPMNRTCLRKSVNTPPQAGLTRHERLSNLRGSFIVSRPDAIKDKRLLLVDDVATTGSTITEAARTIRKAGAARVDALVLALTPMRGNDRP